MIKEVKNKRVSFAISDAMLKSVKLLNLDLAGICRKALEIEIEKEFLQKQEKAKFFYLLTSKDENPAD